VQEISDLSRRQPRLLSRASPLLQRGHRALRLQVLLLEVLRAVCGTQHCKSAECVPALNLRTHGIANRAPERPKGARRPIVVHSGEPEDAAELNEGMSCAHLTSYCTSVDPPHTHLPQPHQRALNEGLEIMPSMRPGLTGGCGHVEQPFGFSRRAGSKMKCRGRAAGKAAERGDGGGKPFSGGGQLGGCLLGAAFGTRRALLFPLVRF
jgi:hypothetical protein